MLLTAKDINQTWEQQCQKLAFYTPTKEGARMKLEIEIREVENGYVLYSGTSLEKLLEHGRIDRRQFVAKDIPDLAKLITKLATEAKSKDQGKK